MTLEERDAISGFARRVSTVNSTVAVCIQELAGVVADSVAASDVRAGQSLQIVQAMNLLKDASVCLAEVGHTAKLVL